VVTTETTTTGRDRRGRRPEDRRAAPAATNDLLDALDELEDLARTDLERTRLMISRVRDLRTRILDGDPLPDIVSGEPRPLVVELISESIRGLQTVGAELRRTEAQALRAHGLTIDHIARLFGVSHQRVSALLRGAEPS
jgi:hypothetical protein